MRALLGITAALFMASASAFAGPSKFLTLEDAAVAQARKWQQTGVAKPIMSDDGKVLFPFGQYLPTITCAPLRACDIELEAGEIVSGKPLAGDTVRWKITHAESGKGDRRTSHIVIKPIDTNLDTNLIVNTDKRTYHLRLVSTSNEKDYLNRVGFYYPQDIADEWDMSARLAEKEAAEKDKLVVSDVPATSIDKLDFAYSIESDNGAIKPLRAFNDGTKVFIQMPDEMRSGEAPILLLYDKSGNPAVVNYRVKDLYYIVDKLFDKAVLVAGVDKGQTKVTITRGIKQKGWFD